MSIFIILTGEDSSVCSRTLGVVIKSTATQWVFIVSKTADWYCIFCKVWWSKSLLQCQCVVTQRRHQHVTAVSLQPWGQVSNLYSQRVSHNVFATKMTKARARTSNLWITRDSVIWQWWHLHKETGSFDKCQSQMSQGNWPGCSWEKCKVSHLSVVAGPLIRSAVLQ